MIEKINDLLSRVEAFSPATAAEVEEFRIKVLGKKGELTALMEEFKSVPAEQKRELGQKINALKQAATERINTLKATLADSAATKLAAVGDMTRPGSAEQDGTRHPISIVKNQIVEIFSRMGYTVAEGPEIEDDWHVFSALNFPLEHPARDMQDTFFVEKASSEPDTKDVMLRTHTSSIQVRAMDHQKPPIRIVCPGRVFRNEAISYRAHCIFHQVEGLYIDENVEALTNEYLAPVAGVQLGLMAEDGTVTAIDGAVCDGEGNVSLSLSEAGAYTVVAYVPAGSDVYAFFAPIAVTVK
ncbi:MAG: phenylalanine--tRNA ligase subunit alpha [Alistipes sp.]|nr:phenylalanine--tRNA ligase subunit alpha [Alistipes sp.]